MNVVALIFAYSFTVCLLYVRVITRRTQIDSIHRSPRVLAVRCLMYGPKLDRGGPHYLSIYYIMPDLSRNLTGTIWSTFIQKSLSPFQFTMRSNETVFVYTVQDYPCTIWQSNDRCEYGSDFEKTIFYPILHIFKMHTTHGWKWVNVGLEL